MNLRPFALGASFGHVPAPPPRAMSGPAAAAARATAATERPAGGNGGSVYHFHVATPDPESFARSRATVARGARRLVGMAERFE
jgi:hypothetical protein